MVKKKAPPPPRGPDQSASDPAPLIVGIGASAGGLEAFSQFFAHLPPENGMVIVVVQHLSPNHSSMLVEILARKTTIPVQEAADGEKMEPDHVYVIPPDATLTVGDGVLHVAKPAPPRQYRWPIDTLFTSLAEEYGDHVVCVVLSGSGSDGARGLRAVKEHGGLTLAQAGFDHVAMLGMPSSAAATGLVDQVLPVEDMPERLLAHYRNLRSSRELQGADGTRDDVASNLQAVCKLLQAETGHDFSQYKEKTLIRRIQRRMQVVQAASMSDYIAYLRREPGEYDLLFNELLINVTEFFRDPEAFEALAGHAIPALLAGKNATDTLRIWVPGCATGEEAYSLAILLKEAMVHGKPQPKVMIFATDIDMHAIETARAGRYPAALPGISPERRELWFRPDGEDFCVAKSIREMCVFSPHSVIKDPPFSRLDLISCRNLLIYLNTDTQQRLMQVFHYALRPGGFLFLGSSESVSRSTRLFTPLDKKQRLYARRDDAQPVFPLPLRRPGEVAPQVLGRIAAEGRLAGEDAIDRSARRTVDKYSPAYVVIDAHRDVVRVGGGAGKYLGLSPGAPSLNLFALLLRELRTPVRQVVNRAFAGGQSAIAERLIGAGEHQRVPLRIIVEPLPGFRDPQSGDIQLCVVTFVELEGAQVPALTAAAEGAGDSGRMQALEYELESTRTQLQNATDQQEATTEELKSANEEYQSVNEELQSSNEELETSKEEMQSINEELQTVNAELTSKNEALAHLNSDLRNLLESTQIATLFLDEHMHIRGYTPAMTEVFHLRQGDRGRPITEISPRIDYPGLRDDVKQVLRELGVIERVLYNDSHGPVFLLRMRPYRTVDNVISGVVLTFVDVTESQKLNQEHARLAAIVNASKDAILGVSLQDRITSWNPAAGRLFGLSAAEAVGRPLDILLPAEASEETRGFFASAEREHRLGEFQMTWVRPDGASVQLEMNWSPVHDDAGKLIAGEIVARDMRERVKAERGASLMMRELDHRVKNTLATVQAIAQQTLRSTDTLEAFGTSFMARLMSLSKTHGLLAREGWSGADLRELVQNELEPYQREGWPSVEIRGESVLLPSKVALALSMALHELATNAIKYGALSVSGGRVEVHWKTHTRRGRQGLQLCWIERGGPAVAQPTHVGFGHRLITEGLAYELDGTVALSYAATGVVCKMDIPDLQLPDRKELGVKRGKDHGQ